MKKIGINKELTLSESFAKFLITHQQNQRSPIERHVNALAKLLARTGWRNDQRICLTEENHLINGLQRLSAIIKLKDFGWKIPVTIFRKDELTSDVIESFNVQKSDNIVRLMSRLYGWSDKRIALITKGIFRCIDTQANSTTNDLFDIYEHLKNSIDKVLEIKESKRPGAKNVNQEIMIAAVCCILDGVNPNAYKMIANEYINHNESGPFWKAMREWDYDWHFMRKGNGENIRIEPDDCITHVAIRFNALKQFAEGKRITRIKKLTNEDKKSLAEHCRNLLRTATRF